MQIDTMTKDNNIEDLSVSNPRPIRKIKQALRYGDFIQNDKNLKNLITKSAQKFNPKKTADNGWYRVDSIGGHRVKNIKNHD